VLIYLAGHGVQLQGQSFFLPTDVRSTLEEDIEIGGIPLRTIFDTVTKKRTARIYIFVIDACREIVVRRSGGRGDFASRGLARTAAPPSAFLAYSTSPGEVATDGKDGGSPFAIALADSIPLSGRTIEETFREVRDAVYHTTSRKQITWDESALFEPFHFVPPSEKPVLGRGSANLGDTGTTCGSSIDGVRTRLT
jgi:uncharacterized protein